MNFIIGERWDWDGSAPCPSNYVIDYAREFWYDGARQRFLNREVDPVKLMNQDVIEALSETWSEYAASPGGGGDGNDIYGDFIITEDPTTVVVTTSYELGIGKTTDPLGSPATSYYHADRLGTTRLLSDPTGGGIDPTIYAAFGELESGTNHRFGYVGKDGYQAHPGAPGLALLHLGARYYDPTTGRFLQRDPIGMKGGFNVYEYVRGNPVKDVDGSGLRTDMGKDRPPGGYPGPKPNPSAPAPPPLLPSMFLACTGGEDSWLDNPDTVDNVRWALHAPAVVASVHPGVKGAQAMKIAITAAAEFVIEGLRRLK